MGSAREGSGGVGILEDWADAPKPPGRTVKASASDWKDIPTLLTFPRSARAPVGRR